VKISIISELDRNINKIFIPSRFVTRVELVEVTPGRRGGGWTLVRRGNAAPEMVRVARDGL
jgi:hypothetical protein